MSPPCTDLMKTVAFYRQQSKDDFERCPGRIAAQRRGGRSVRELDFLDGLFWARA